MKVRGRVCSISIREGSPHEIERVVDGVLQAAIRVQTPPKAFK
jgi:hypothetical protein